MPWKLSIIVCRLQKTLLPIAFFNPSQTPMDASKQFASSQKELKFKNLRIFDKHFTLLGGLHVEHCVLSLHREFVKGSGLQEILANSNLPITHTGAAVNSDNKKTGQILLPRSCWCCICKTKRSFF